MELIAAVTDTENPSPAGASPSGASDSTRASPSGASDSTRASEPEAGPRKLGPGEEKTDDELLREAAALLFASSEPLGPARLAELLGRPSGERVRRVLERLGAELEASPLPVTLKRIAGGWRLLSAPEAAETIARLRAEPRSERISAAALETLAIIAYRQPVTKAEIEAIRGVQAGPVLRGLIDRGLVRVTGRAELPGSPLLYGTTREFLERFGLASLQDLPRDGELNED